MKLNITIIHFIMLFLIVASLFIGWALEVYHTDDVGDPVGGTKKHQ